MKVKELISLLQLMDEDMQVFLEDSKGLQEKANGIVEFDNNETYAVVISVFNTIDRIMKGF